MKKIYFLFFFFISIVSYSQVSINVSAIEIDQPVTFTVDITSTATNCNGFNNPTKVYMHAGIGDKNNAFAYDVVGNWGQDDGIGEMTNNNDGTFSITITPQSYFSLTQTEIENAAQIGMVFRNENGSQEFKDNGCADFIFPIGAVQLNLLAPTEDLVVINSGDNLVTSTTISFQGTTTVQGQIEVFYNNVSQGTANCGFPNCNFTINNITESGEVKIVGNPPSPNQAQSGEIKFNVVVAPTVTQETIPAGLKDGVNYTNDATKAFLVLTAPNKEFIQVAGSFNNYSPTSNHVMKQDPTSGKFWIELTGLTSGQIETYQYWVFDTTPTSGSPSLVKTADPFSALVLSPFDDSGIPSTSYPNMPSYPDGQEREVTVLQTGKTPYNWTVTNFQKPKKEDLIVYEVLVRDFDADRNYQDIIDRIDYFKNLNINAIQLMPIMEFDGNETWGYNTSFHYALDKFYGTQDKFKELVDLCHQNGIAVILDIALNHATGRNPLVRMWMDDPDGDGWGGPAVDNPYFNTTAQHDYSVFNDFNHQSSYTKNYTKQVVRHWIEEYKIDGFRWDLTKGFTQNCGPGSVGGCTDSYQQDRVDVLKDYADYSWSIDNDHYVIFEHLGQDNEEQQWANYRLGEGKGIMMWGKMTAEYTDLVQGFSTNIARASHKARGFSAPRLMMYPESHDEERIMYEAVNYGNNSFSSHNVRNLNVALKRMASMASISLTIPGPKMVWHFASLGMDDSIWTCGDGSVNPGDDGCKLATKPQPQWSENWMQNADRKNVYDTWSKLIALKTQEDVFEGDFTLEGNSQNVRLYIFDNNLPNTQLKNVVVLANFNVTGQNITPNFPYTGQWYNLMDNTSINVTSTTEQIFIPAGEFRIFGNQAATLSNDDIVLENSLFSLYPNPTKSKFSLNKEAKEVTIYDIKGKMVKSYNEDIIKNNTFEISNLNKGIYLVRIKSETNKVLMKKLIIN